MSFVLEALLIQNGRQVDERKQDERARRLVVAPRCINGLAEFTQGMNQTGALGGNRRLDQRWQSKGARNRARRCEYSGCRVQGAVVKISFEQCGSK